jgi:hypothetical protein
MRGAVFAAAALFAAAGTAAAAVPQPIGPPAVFDDNAATVAVRPGVVSAQPTTVKLTLQYPRLCGKPTGGTVAITFPKGELVPARIPLSAVAAPGLRIKAIVVSGKTVKLSLAPLPTSGVTCQSITLAPLALTLKPAAGLGNPDSAGAYTVTAKRGTATYAAQFQVSS